MKLKGLFSRRNQVFHHCVPATFSVRRERNSISEKLARQSARGPSVGADEFSFVANAVKDGAKRVFH